MSAGDDNGIHEIMTDARLRDALGNLTVRSAAVRHCLPLCLLSTSHSSSSSRLPRRRWSHYERGRSQDLPTAGWILSIRTSAKNTPLDNVR